MYVLPSIWGAALCWVYCDVKQVGIAGSRRWNACEHGEARMGNRSKWREQ